MSSPRGKKDDPRRAAVDVLARVFGAREYADAVLDASLRESRLSPRDRSLTTEIVYGTLRWHGWLDFVLRRAATGDWENVPERVRYHLEVALYQILFLDRIPEFAAVNEAVRLAKVEGARWGGLVNGMLRAVLRKPELLEPPAEEGARALAIRWSHPLWLVERWMTRFGRERTEAICRANNERPRMGVRVNRLRVSLGDAKARLEDSGFEVRPSDFLDEFLTVDRGQGLRDTGMFKTGGIFIQDESAGLVARLVNSKPGERILDMAAAPGGKATHLAELSEDRAFIIAADARTARMGRILENRERLGLESVIPVVADGRAMAFGEGAFDRVLLDAPCSGLGVIRRRGELRWRKTTDDVGRLTEIQAALMEATAALVVKGGVLVYSTCTVLQEENEGIVDSFLERHADFEVEAADRYVDERVVNDRGFVETWPDVHGMDGSFAVRLRKTE